MAPTLREASALAEWFHAHEHVRFCLGLQQVSSRRIQRLAGAGPTLKRHLAADPQNHCRDNNFRERHGSRSSSRRL